MWHGRQRVERSIAFRRASGIRDRGAMHVKTHVIAQLALHEDIADQPFVARPRQDRVMADVLPFITRAFGAEIPDEKPIDHRFRANFSGVQRRFRVFRSKRS